MELATVHIDKDSQQIMVNGALSFATVPLLRVQGNQLLATVYAPIFDFKGVVRTDSAALALLTAWARDAKQLGKKPQFINLPEQLIDLARLSNLDKILLLSS